MLIKRFRRLVTKFSTEFMPKCTHISVYKSFDIAPNILYTIYIIVKLLSGNCPTRVHIANDISIGSSVFAALTNVSNTMTIGRLLIPSRGRAKIS